MVEVAESVETACVSMFPLEFHLIEVPLSLQARGSSKEKWKTIVAGAARRRAEEAVELVWLDDTPVAVTIFYFPTAPMAGDVDNIVKPILDALNGHAYKDDRLIERVVSQKFEPDIARSFGSPSAQLTAALDAISASDEPQPVVYIRIDDDLSWRAQP
jgi:hypothetical protein